MRERTQPYKEDSTKGGSILLNPLNYKGDVLVQVWIDSRVLATLNNWMEKESVYPRFMSEVVRKPLENLAAQLVDNGDVEIVDDTVIARKMLEQKFRIVLNRGGRGGKNILHNQLLSEKRLDLGEKMREGHRYTDAQKPIGRNTRVDPAVLEEAVARYRKLEQEELDKQKADAIESGKNSSLLAKDENA